MVKFQDYYETLGLSRDATQAQIQKAFRKLAQKYHPDVNKEKSAEDKFKKINEAQEVLSDPKKRKLYDQLGQNWQAGQDFRPPPGYGGADFGNFDFSGAGQAGGGFSDFFQSIFGAKGGAGPGGFADIFAAASGAKAQRQAAPTEAELEVSIEELFHAAKKKVSLRITEQDAMGRPSVRTKELTVKIPSGVSSGSVIRLSGQGASGGDLLLKLKVQSDSRYRLEDGALVVVAKIAPWEAALGTSINLKIFNEELKLNLPAGTQSGQRMRLKAKGLPQSGGAKGDAFVVFEVAIPKNLSADERKIYEDLKRVSPAVSR